MQINETVKSMLLSYTKSENEYDYILYMIILDNILSEICRNRVKMTSHTVFEAIMGNEWQSVGWSDRVLSTDSHA